MFPVKKKWKSPIFHGQSERLVSSIRQCRFSWRAPPGRLTSAVLEGWGRSLDHTFTVFYRQWQCNITLKGIKRSKRRPCWTQTIYTSHQLILSHSAFPQWSLLMCIKKYIASEDLWKNHLILFAWAAVCLPSCCTKCFMETGSLRKFSDIPLAR